MQYGVVTCCMGTTLVFIQFYRKKTETLLIPFWLEPTLLKVNEVKVFHFPLWYSEHTVMIIIWYIFDVGVALALMLCKRTTWWVISCIFLNDTDEWHERQEGLNCDWTWYKWNKKINFVFSFFNTSRVDPKPPFKPYWSGSGCTCCVCSRRLSLSAIKSSLWQMFFFLHVRGKKKMEDVSVFKGLTHKLMLSIVLLLITVWWPNIVLKDVPLSNNKKK